MHGFTRLDLLAVTVALASLAALVPPVLGQAQEKAVRVMCLDNLRKVGLGFHLFASNHGGQFPMALPSSQGGTSFYLGSGDTGGAIETWRHFWALATELGQPNVLVCPSDAGRVLVNSFSDVQRRNRAISYGLGVGSRQDHPRMLLATDRSIVGGTPKFYFNDNAKRGNLGTNRTALETLEWDARGMHLNGGNFLAVDGSARPLNAALLREQLANSGDSKNNYSQPGWGASSAPSVAPSPSARP